MEDDSPYIVILGKCPDKSVLISVYDCTIERDLPLYVGKLGKKKLLEFLNGDETELGLTLESLEQVMPIIRDM